MSELIPADYLRLSALGRRLHIRHRSPCSGVGLSGSGARDPRSCGVPQLRVAQHQAVQAHSRALAMIGRRLRKHGTQVRHHALQRGTVSDAPPCIIPQTGGKWTQPVSCQIRTFVPNCADALGAFWSRAWDCPRARARASSRLMPRNSSCRSSVWAVSPRLAESDASHRAGRRNGRAGDDRARPRRAGSPARRRRARPCSMIGAMA